MVLLPFLLSHFGQQDSVVNISSCSADRFVKKLAENGIAPAAIFADPSLEIPAVIGYPKKAFTVPLLKRETRLLAYGSTYGFSASTLPPGFFLWQTEKEGYVRAVGKPASLSLKDGKITVGANGASWVRVSDLKALELGRPFDVQWSYLNAFVAVTPGTFPADQLIQTVGDALGAEVKVEQNRVQYLFDASKHRKRAAALFDDPHWNPSSIVLGWSRKIYVTGIAEVSDDQWKQAFVARDSSYTVENIPASSPVVSAAVKGLQQMCDYVRETNQDATYQFVSKDLQHLDLKHTVRVQVTADGHVQAGIKIENEKRWVFF